MPLTQASLVRLCVSVQPGWGHCSVWVCKALSEGGLRQVLPMPLDDGELADIVREVGSKLVRLELQAVRAQPPLAKSAQTEPAGLRTQRLLDHVTARSQV